ncbi:AMP-binding protein [Streptomyces mirabilis]|uniref:AMP-binding protein n=1 Tax=Streptomyces mirabilis TaxID=68239 RepID=UPI0036D8DF8B
MSTTASPYEVLGFDALRERPGIGVSAARPDGPWHLPWHRLSTTEAAGPRAELFAGDYEFHTSGSTGEPVRRILPGTRLRADAEQLARLLAPYAPEAIVSFAPPRHAYGASATMMLPAVTGLPVWFWPSFDCPPPPVAARRVAFVAIPWTFRILTRHPQWTAAFEQLTVLHSSAELPAEASRFQDDARTTMIEVLGSTETSAVAHRSGWDAAGAWTLFDDVTFAGAHTAEEAPLTVSSPRLSALADGSHPDSHEMDDLIRRLDDRRFSRTGRRAHLVKINGVRYDLNGIAARLRAALPGADVACVRAADQLRGETYDVFVAGGGPLTADGVRAIARGLGATPRDVRLVDRIPRSSLGKLLAGPEASA